MKLEIGAKAARAAMLAAVAARVFVGLAVDAPAPHNGAWLSALLGGLLAAPWLLCADGLRKAGYNTPLSIPLSAALLAVTLADAAAVLSDVTRSAGYLSLERAPALALALPACLAALWCVHKNGDALGYGATIWLRVFPAMLALVIALQLRHYRPAWLTPLLGTGWRDIANGAVRTAGRIVPASAVLLLARDDEKARGRSTLWTLSGTVGIAALMLALWLMMSPTTLGLEPWLMRLDGLLTNGRAPLYLQLPMIALWFTGLLHLLCAEVFAAAGLLQRVIPGLDGRACGAAVVAAVAALSGAAAPSRIMDGMSQWNYVFVAATTGLAALCVRRKGGAP